MRAAPGVLIARLTCDDPRSPFTAGPRHHELEGDEPSNAREIPLVLRHEHATRPRHDKAIRISFASFRPACECDPLPYAPCRRAGPPTRCQASADVRHCTDLVAGRSSGHCGRVPFDLSPFHTVPQLLGDYDTPVLKCAKRLDGSAGVRRWANRTRKVLMKSGYRVGDLRAGESPFGHLLAKSPRSPEQRSVHRRARVKHGKNEPRSIASVAVASPSHVSPLSVSPAATGRRERPAILGGAGVSYGGIRYGTSV